MGIWIPRGEDIVGKIGDEKGDNESRNAVPFADDSGDELIELDHPVVETHDGDGEGGKRKECKAQVSFQFENQFQLRNIAS